MQKRTNRQKTRTIPITGLCTTLAALAGILCLLALLVQKGTMPEELLHPALLLGCLLSAIAGCVVSSGGGERLGTLLSGAVPAVLLLCCGIVAGGGEGTGRWAIWNAAALLIPCLTAQLFRGNKRRKRRR